MHWWIPFSAGWNPFKFVKEYDGIHSRIEWIAENEWNSLMGFIHHPIHWMEFFHQQSYWLGGGSINKTIMTLYHQVLVIANEMKCHQVKLYLIWISARRKQWFCIAFHTLSKVSRHRSFQLCFPGFPIMFECFAWHPMILICVSYWFP